VAAAAAERLVGVLGPRDVESLRVFVEEDGPEQ
jgi:hypothetical protein